MRKSFFIWLLLLPFQVVAQQFYTSNQQIIEEGVKNGVVLISQSYQLKDTTTNMLYGRSGNEEFGRIYSLGVKVRDGIVVENSVLCPWDYDENFNRYRDTHVPVLFTTAYKELSDSSMTKYEGLHGFEKYTLCQDKLTQVNDTVLFGGEGFLTDGELGEKEGWLIWVAGNQEMEASDSAPVSSFIIYRHSVALSDSISEWIVNAPNTDLKLWGGIFVNPVRTSVGLITIKLCGILTESADGWKLLAPFRKEELSGAEGRTIGSDLTPVSDSSSVRQQDTKMDDRKDNKQKRNKKQENNKNYE